MRKWRTTVSATAFVAGALFAVSTGAVELSFTDFESFSLGSVDGQGGWSADNTSIDQEVVDDGSGNQVWRVSNSFTTGSFGDQPFAPCPGGIPTDTVNDPDNGNPGKFAGESSTGATYSRFYGEFNFRSATQSAQPGLRLTVSADNCQGGRQSFIAIEDNGTGLDVVTFNVNRAGLFAGAITIANNLSYSEWHTFAVEVVFHADVANDVVRYYVDGTLVHTDGSWEQFYRNFQASLHPHGVPVQTLLYRLSGTPAPSVDGNGFYIDNVLTEISYPLRLPLDPGRK